MENIDAKKFLTEELSSRGYIDIRSYLKGIQYGEKSQCYVYHVIAVKKITASATQHVDNEFHVWSDENGWSMV